MSATVTIDIGIIDWIDSVLCMDLAPPRGVIEALHDREQAHYDAWTNPDADDQLVEDIRKALDGGWLQLDEVRAFQRLRGWHRVRYGNVTVPREHLADAAYMLGCISSDYADECDQTLEDYGLSRVGPPEDPYWVTGPHWPSRIRERAGVLKSMAERGTCGECTYCQIVSLREQCYAILNAPKEA